MLPLGLLRQLLVTRWISLGYDGGTNPPTAVLDVSSVRTFTLASRYRFLRIQSISGDVVVTIGQGGAVPDDPNAASLRVRSGTTEIFHLPQDADTIVKVLGLSDSKTANVLVGV